MKRNYHISKMEQNRQNQVKEDAKNIIAFVSDSDKALVLLDDRLHVDE